MTDRSNAKKNTLGNQCRYRDWGDDARNPDRMKNKKQKQSRSLDIVSEVLGLKDCCHSCKNSNHILNHFNDDFNASIEFVDNCRDKTESKRWKNKENLCQFIASEYKKCRIGFKMVNGAKKDVVDWQINGVKLCRKSFVACYGISHFFLDQVVYLLKANGDDTSFASHKPYKDSFVPKLTYMEMKSTFEENYVDPGQ